jgi:hypothetical protein
MRKTYLLAGAAAVAHERAVDRDAGAGIWLDLGIKGKGLDSPQHGCCVIRVECLGDGEHPVGVCSDVGCPPTLGDDAAVLFGPLGSPMLMVSEAGFFVSNT